VAFSRGRGFALGFVEGGHRKRLILALKPSISYLFHDLGAFSQDLDLYGGERNQI
jgi:hypothetical protein